MTDSAAWIIVGSLMGLWLLQGKQMAKMQREIDLLVKGDLETLRLKRKLDGYPDMDA